MMHVGDTMSTSGDIMMHAGEQGHKSLSIYTENPDILNIPHVLMISPTCIMISSLMY